MRVSGIITFHYIEHSNIIITFNGIITLWTLGISYIFSQKPDRCKFIGLYNGLDKRGTKN